MLQTPHSIDTSGPSLLSQVAASSPAAKRMLDRTAIYPLGGICLPESVLGQHSVYLGQIGCGKTLEMLQYCWRTLQTVLWNGTPLLRHRALFFDGKGNDIVHNFQAWVPPDRLALVCPFHPEGVRWAIGRDVKTFEAGQQVGYGLVPQTQKSHPFFDEAVRQLVQGVTHVLQLNTEDWYLLDLVEACTHEALLRHVLAHHPRGKEILASYFPKRTDTVLNILQSMRIALTPWRTMALLEAKAEQSVTISGWMRSGGVFGLLGSPRDPDVVDPYNALFFKYAVRHIRSRPDNRPMDHSYLFVDELPESILEDYVSALLLGRSKGLRSAATIQDPASLITRLGSREKANEILGQFGNLWMGRVTGPDAADWLARFFGKYEHWFEKRGGSWDGQRHTQSWSEDMKEKFYVDPDDFKTFPMATLDGGYTAVARNPHVRGWRMHVDGDFIKMNLGPRPVENDLPPHRVLTREDLAYTWGPDDFNRLGLRPLPNWSRDAAKDDWSEARSQFRLPE